MKQMIVLLLACLSTRIDELRKANLQIRVVDTNGMVTLRSFKGDYTVTCGEGGAAHSMALRLIEDHKSEVTLRPESVCYL